MRANNAIGKGLPLCRPSPKDIPPLTTICTLPAMSVRQGRENCALLQGWGRKEEGKGGEIEETSIPMRFFFFSLFPSFLHKHHSLLSLSLLSLSPLSSPLSPSSSPGLRDCKHEIPTEYVARAAAAFVQAEPAGTGRPAGAVGACRPSRQCQCQPHHSKQPRHLSPPLSLFSALLSCFSCDFLFPYLLVVVLQNANFLLFSYNFIDGCLCKLRPHKIVCLFPSFKKAFPKKLYFGKGAIVKRKKSHTADTSRSQKEKTKPPLKKR